MHVDEEMVVVGSSDVVSCNVGTQYLIHRHMMSNHCHIHQHSGIQEPGNFPFSEGVELGNVLRGTVITKSRSRVRYELRFEVVLTWLASFTLHVLSDSELLGKASPAPVALEGVRSVSVVEEQVFSEVCRRLESLCADVASR
jgi:hypothetical protein